MANERKQSSTKKIEDAVNLLLQHGYTVIPPKEEVIIDSTEVRMVKLEPHRKRLINQMMPYRNMYTSEMLNEFYAYWTEPNRSLTKLRWEMEKTWSIERRLKTWYKFYIQQSNGRKRINTTDEQRINKLASILTDE